MYMQKGFLSNTTFTNNNPGQVATLGELSPMSSTYSQNKGYYTDNVDAPNIVLTSFFSVDASTPVAVPALIAEQILDIGNYIYGNSNTTITAAILLANLTAEFSSEANTFLCGNIIGDGTHFLPEWISWQTTVDSTRPSTLIQVWFVDASFAAQYDEYQIVIVPPITPLDNFFNTGASVVSAINAITQVQVMNGIQAAKAGYPETIIATQSFVYTDPSNSSNTVETNWNILIYGQAGNNPDAIRNALITYILANSTHTQDQWATIIPTVFELLEFILVPMWGQYAIPARTVQTGIYSPQVNLVAAATLLAEYATLYPSGHVTNNGSVMGFPYCSIAICSVGSNNNPNSEYQLTDVFPDLLDISSTSTDFARMTLTTQNFATMLATMIYIAETMNQYTLVPTGMLKLIRNGKLYLSQNFNGLNYLIAAKLNFITS